MHVCIPPPPPASVQVEGRCEDPLGFVVAVTGVLHVSAGLIDESGYGVFEVDYEAVMFNPVPGEVFDATVTQVSEAGIFANYACATIFIDREVSIHQLLAMI